MNKMGEGGGEVVEIPSKDSGTETNKLPSVQEKPDSWRLIEPQPLREDQVRNAVNFLSHPKVKGSPIVYRRSFLEKKGLTKEEIDEAFRRVPDPPSSDSGNLVASPQGGEKQSPGVAVPKPLAPSQAPQYAPTQVTIPAVPVRRNRLPWTQMVLAVGVFAAAGAGAAVLTKKYIYPRFKAWLRNVVLEGEPMVMPAKPSSLEEVVSASAAAAAAAAAAHEIAAITRDIVNRQSEDRQYFENMMKAVETQTQELKLTLASMRDTILSIEKAAKKSAARSLPVKGSETIGNASVSHLKLGSVQQSAKEQKPLERPGNSGTGPIMAPNVKVPDSASLKPTSEKSSRNSVNDAPSDYEKSPVFVSTATSSSSEPWWRRKRGDLEYAHTSTNWAIGNNVRITELDADNDTNTFAAKEYSYSAQPGSGTTVASSIVTEVHQGWVPPPVPQTVLPGAAAAIRHQKAVTNGYEVKPSSVPYLGSVPTPSSTGFESEPAVSASQENGLESSAQRAPSPESNGQEVNIISESVTDKPLYKDVVVEGEES